MKSRIGTGAYVAILTAALFGLFALVWLYTATQRTRFLPEQSSSWQAHAQMVRECDVGKIAIFGSSRAMAAFIPRLLGTDIVNLALSGATPVEAYFEARKVYSCPHYPRTAIVSFSPEDFDRSNWFWSQSARFGLISGEDLGDLARSAKSLQDDLLYQGSFGSEPPPAMKNFMYASHFPPYDAASLFAASFGGSRSRENIRLTRETLENQGQHLVWQKESRCGDPRIAGRDFSANVSEFSPRPLTTLYFRRLLDLLNAKNVAVYYVATPMNKIELQYYSKDYIKAYKKFLSFWAKQRSGFRPIGTYTPLQDTCDFADLVHVNQAGAETFSRRVRPMISAASAATSTKAVPVEALTAMGAGYGGRRGHGPALARRHDRVPVLPVLSEKLVQ